MKILSEEDLQFLSNIKASLNIDSQCEVFLKYKETYILLEPHGTEIVVYVNGQKMQCFISFDELVNQFIIDGKPFKEIISEIEYE